MTLSCCKNSSSLGEHPRRSANWTEQHLSPQSHDILHSGHGSQLFMPLGLKSLCSWVHPLRASLHHVPLTAIQTRVPSQLSVTTKCLMVSESWEFSSFKDLSNSQRIYSLWIEFRLLREKEKKRDTITDGLYDRTRWYTMVEWGYYDKEGGFMIENMVPYDREGLYDRGSMAEML